MASVNTEKSPIEIEAAKILKEHPNQKAVYMTADGFGYFNHHDALNHSRVIKDDKIVTIKR